MQQNNNTHDSSSLTAEHNPLSMDPPTLAELENEFTQAMNKSGPAMLVAVLATAVGGTSEAVNIRLTARRALPLLHCMRVLGSIFPTECINGEVFGAADNPEAPLQVFFLEKDQAPESPRQITMSETPSRIALQASDELPDPVEGWLDLRLPEDDAQNRFLAERLASNRTRTRGSERRDVIDDFPHFLMGIYNRINIQGEPMLVAPVQLPADLPTTNQLPETADLTNRLALGATCLTGTLDDDGCMRGERDLAQQVALLLVRAGAVQPGLELSSDMLHFFDVLRVLVAQTGAVSIQQILEQLHSSKFRQRVEDMVAQGKIAPATHDRPWSDRRVRLGLKKLWSHGYVQRLGSRTQYTWTVPACYREAGLVNTLNMIASATDAA